MKNKYPYDKFMKKLEKIYCNTIDKNVIDDEHIIRHKTYYLNKKSKDEIKANEILRKQQQKIEMKNKYNNKEFINEKILINTQNRKNKSIKHNDENIDGETNISDNNFENEDTGKKNKSLVNKVKRNKSTVNKN